MRFDRAVLSVLVTLVFCGLQHSVDAIAHTSLLQDRALAEEASLYVFQCGQESAFDSKPGLPPPIASQPGEDPSIPLLRQEAAEGELKAQQQAAAAANSDGHTERKAAECRARLAKLRMKFRQAVERRKRAQLALARRYTREIEIAARRDEDVKRARQEDQKKADRVTESIKRDIEQTQKEEDRAEEHSRVAKLEKATVNQQSEKPAEKAAAPAPAPAGQNNTVVRSQDPPLIVHMPQNATIDHITPIRAEESSEETQEYTPPIVPVKSDPQVESRKDGLDPTSAAQQAIEALPNRKSGDDASFAKTLGHGATFGVDGHARFKAHAGAQQAGQSAQGNGNPSVGNKNAAASGPTTNAAGNITKETPEQTAENANRQRTAVLSETEQREATINQQNKKKLERLQNDIDAAVRKLKEDDAAEAKAAEAKLDQEAEEKAHQAALQRKQELIDKWTRMLNSPAFADSVLDNDAEQAEKARVLRAYVAKFSAEIVEAKKEREKKLEKKAEAQREAEKVAKEKEAVKEAKAAYVRDLVENGIALKSPPPAGVARAVPTYQELPADVVTLHDQETYSDTGREPTAPSRILDRREFVASLDARRDSTLHPDVVKREPENQANPDLKIANVEGEVAAKL